MRWYVGSDHAGFALKRHLCEVLRTLGDEVNDLGTTSEESVDYPDYGAALCTEAFTASAARAHNDANVLALGARVIGAGVAEACVRAFRDTAFEGGRHARRVAKLNTLDDAAR
jgi:ribose 5-phosphate isomerase B